MIEADWKEILSFSQKELGQADKEKLCESLSWMEVDDIELNFTDLKTLFRTAQDILKYKSEQVNNLRGELGTLQRKDKKKSKIKSARAASPTKSENSHELIAHQEEEIKANKEILKQLQMEIAKLESRQQDLEEAKEKDSESSRGTLSEINSVMQLENDLSMKNKHIMKLLNDIKIYEEENESLRKKISVFKDKLTESTQLIENLTEQLFTINNEMSQMKEIIGKSEQAKAQLSTEVESLKNELYGKDLNKENLFEQTKEKLQHWKSIVRSKKAEIELLISENMQLKEDLMHASKPQIPPKTDHEEESKIKELHEKLSDASKQIIQSANVIELLKSENKQLKGIVEKSSEDNLSLSMSKNESDDGKERILISKLKKKVELLTTALQKTEEILTEREKELAETTSHLKLLQSEDGANSILEALKAKKRQVKFKDEEIKSLVHETNTLNHIVKDLQLQNESMRQKLNIPINETISTRGILKKHNDMKKRISELTNELNKIEHKLVLSELDNRNLNSKLTKLIKLLIKKGYGEDVIKKIIDSSLDEDNADESLVSKDFEIQGETQKRNNAEDMQNIIEENEGLRKGLQEILDFLKDNSTTSSGILSLQCPSLDAILEAMEARHTAGWYAPHMSTVMQLRAAIGSKDALLTALHEARKETFEVMTKLSKESKRSLELELKVEELEKVNKSIENAAEFKTDTIDIGEFGTWMSDKKEEQIDFHDASQIESIIGKRNSMYEYQLKKGLLYCHNKFKALFDKMTHLAVQAAEDQNKWAIQEEQYKAQIEKLKSELPQNDEDNSDHSSGLIVIPSISFLQRKCSYLAESYKYIRTLNENIKNENLESKRDVMVLSCDFETQIQKLMLTIVNLNDKLRFSVPVRVFWKQNQELNDTVIKYRKLIDQELHARSDLVDLYKRLENDKIDAIVSFHKKLQQTNSQNEDVKTLISQLEQSVLQNQLKQVSAELEEKIKQIHDLEKINTELHQTQAKVIDDTLSSATVQEINLMKDQLDKLTEENKIIKEQCLHVESQLDIALLQLQDKQQKQINYDIEINMLRHQILDLQANGDNKSIIARLSGEVLVAHLQASESHKKIERLNSTLNKEKRQRIEVEELIRTRQNIFDVYTQRYESKLRYMHDIMQILRQQYHGSLPLTSVEKYLNNLEDLSRKTHSVDEKLSEIEDLQASLLTKHNIFEQILDVSKNKCLEDEDSCQHKLKYIMMQGIHSRELEHSNKKIKILEQTRDEVIKQCNELERMLILVNQGFEKTTLEDVEKKKNGSIQGDVPNLELEDIQSDDEPSTRRSRTITLPKPQVLKPMKNSNNESKVEKEETADILIGSPVKVVNNDKIPKSINVFIQTNPIESSKVYKSTQTDEDAEVTKMNSHLKQLEKTLQDHSNALSEAKGIIHDQNECIRNLNQEKGDLESLNHNLKVSYHQSNKLNERFKDNIEDLRKQLDDLKTIYMTEKHTIRDTTSEENKALILTLRQLENDKNSIISEYKELLNSEREEYSKTMTNLNKSIMDLQLQLDRKERGSASDASKAEPFKEVVSKYTMKIAELEDKCFKLQSELDGCKTELITYKSEVDRWKNLATERLTKLEQLNSQLEERHCYEVESYKAENEHWLSQLNETQRGHIELRARLAEQRAVHIKQLAEKDAHLEQMRTIIQNLKTQIMNMQTVMSVNDPSFDLSAIVEVDEASDGLSQQGSDRLELKFDSNVDFHEMQDEIVRMPVTSTTIWQEPVIERLRREKQLVVKQNSILRRQIKALASRERRARLDAQNLKNQIFRISTSGSKGTTAEAAALHNKIATLQAQLTSARRDTHSTVALWDKWKRSQQAAERWQARYEEKCQEVKKLDASLHLAKSALSRLEKEKRVLLTRLSDVKNEKQLVFEKQDNEHQEKSIRAAVECVCVGESPVSARALLDRVQAQQRRIAALEVAEKGNELLVSEYEKALAQITSLKGQVLKLESTVLESQIRSPLKSANDASDTELDYWKNYCEMLKEENVQLNLKVNSLETAPMTAHQHRVNDLEQTVLTLRSLVSKLQAEQKSSGVQKRIESRPSSGRSGSDKSRTQLESHRTEIANLKRCINEKDLLLERSKEMLKIAAEREDELLRQNAQLRRRIDELTKWRGGFMSA